MPTSLRFLPCWSCSSFGHLRCMRRRSCSRRFFPVFLCSMHFVSKMRWSMYKDKQANSTKLWHPLEEFGSKFQVLEFFAGRGNLSRVMKSTGLRTGSFDIEYVEWQVGKEYQSDVMDITGTSGFAWFDSIGHCGCFSSLYDYIYQSFLLDPFGGLFMGDFKSRTTFFWSWDKLHGYICFISIYIMHGIKRIYFFKYSFFSTFIYEIKKMELLV